MIKIAFYKGLLIDINQKEQQFSTTGGDIVLQSSDMIVHLHETLHRLRKYFLGLKSVTIQEEVELFKEVKPQVLGKLIFYNEVYRIETSCPFSEGKMYIKYFSAQLKLLKKNSRLYRDNEFFRYYRSGRSDRDGEYFVRGQLHHFTGLNSFYFETDPNFSTYYDHLLARIIAHELLYAFLLTRIDPETRSTSLSVIPDELRWTGTKNALIELIYALYIAGVISNGKIGLRKITLIFQSIFKTPLGDVHHAFHRMKDRAGKRTLFIDQLKDSLEHYMDKSL
ncbi:MAG: RteC domain-containing protein [Bacteroidia bacterium]